MNTGLTRAVIQNKVENQQFFSELFSFLDHVGYVWQPLIPDKLVKCRKTGELFNRWIRYFGLGAQVDRNELELNGLSRELIRDVDSLNLAISRSGNFYVPHSHWPVQVDKADQYVHFGKESLLLLNQLYRHWFRFKSKRMLDLGCGSGALAIELGQVADEVLGLDSCAKAIQWAQASHRAQCKNENVSFKKIKIGEDSFNPSRGAGTWDVAIFSPPLAIPKRGARFPHRDGGPRGVELPLLFLDFAEQVLGPEGEVFCLMTNPVCRGESVLFSELSKRNWIIQERICLDSRFNHQLARQEEYRKYNIDTIELHFLYLKKNSF